MNLYIAHPEYAPHSEAVTFPASDDAEAREYAEIVLSCDRNTGYDSPSVTLYRVPGVVLETVGTFADVRPSGLFGFNQEYADTANQAIRDVHDECPVPASAREQAGNGHSVIWACRDCSRVHVRGRNGQRRATGLESLRYAAEARESEGIDKQRAEWIVQRARDDVRRGVIAEGSADTFRAHLVDMPELRARAEANAARAGYTLIDVDPQGRVVNR